MTQLEEARNGRITEAMRQVASYEDISAERIRQGVADGSIVIPKNINHSLSVFLLHVFFAPVIRVTKPERIIP